jgi:hypothetical protein
MLTGGGQTTGIVWNLTKYTGSQTAGAKAAESIDMIDTGASILARRRSTFVDIGLA